MKPGACGSSAQLQDSDGVKLQLLLMFTSGALSLMVWMTTEFVTVVAGQLRM